MSYFPEPAHSIKELNTDWSVSSYAPKPDWKMQQVLIDQNFPKKLIWLAWN